MIDQHARINALVAAHVEKESLGERKRVGTTVNGPMYGPVPDPNTGEPSLGAVWVVLVSVPQNKILRAPDLAFMVPVPGVMPPDSEFLLAASYTLEKARTKRDELNARADAQAQQLAAQAAPASLPAGLRGAVTLGQPPPS